MSLVPPWKSVAGLAVGSYWYDVAARPSASGMLGAFAPSF
jgi:hypothetical protein